MSDVENEEPESDIDFDDLIVIEKARSERSRSLRPLQGCCSEYIEELRLTIETCPGVWEGQRDARYARVAFAIIDFGRATDDGIDPFTLCDDHSQGLYEFAEVLFGRNGGVDERPDEYFDNSCSTILYLEGIIIEPQFISGEHEEVGGDDTEENDASEGEEIELTEVEKTELAEEILEHIIDRYGRRADKFYYFVQPDEPAYLLRALVMRGFRKTPLRLEWPGASLWRLDTESERPPLPSQQRAHADERARRLEAEANTARAKRARAHVDQRPIEDSGHAEEPAERECTPTAPRRRARIDTQWAQALAAHLEAWNAAGLPSEEIEAKKSAWPLSLSGGERLAMAGEVKPLREWLAVSNVTLQVFAQRVKRGWTLRAAATLPTKPAELGRYRVALNGETRSVDEWLGERAFPSWLLRNKIHDGLRFRRELERVIVDLSEGRLTCDLALPCAEWCGPDTRAGNA